MFTRKEFVDESAEREGIAMAKFARKYAFRRHGRYGQSQLVARTPDAHNPEDRIRRPLRKRKKSAK